MTRRFKTGPKDPSNIRSSSIRRTTGPRSPDNRFEMSKVKRVKFTNTEADHIPNSRPDASSMRCETDHAPRSDAPKTSEYAFFQRLRKGAGGSHCLPLGQDDNQFKNAESSDCNRAISDKFKHSSKDLSSSFLAEKARPINQYSFLTSVIGESKKSDVSDKVHYSCKDCISPLLTEKVTPVNHNLFPSPLSAASKNTVNQDSEKGLFFATRQKLRQLVAHTYLPEVDVLCSKGFDLVSFLLSRLLPERNESNYCRYPKSKEGETVTKYQLPSFRESGTLLRELDWAHTRNSDEYGNGSNRKDGSSKYWPKYTFLSELDTVGSDSPLINYDETHFQYKNRNYGYDLDAGRFANFCRDSDSSFRLSFGKYGSISSSCLKELDQFRDLNELELGKEPCNLLLGLDFNEDNDERDLSLTHHNREMNLYCPLQHSWADDHQQILYNRLDSSSLSLSSLFSSYSPEVTSLPHLYSASRPIHEFRRQSEDQKYLVAELDHFPFTLSFTPKHLKNVEDFSTDNSFEGKSIILSPQYHPSFTGNIFSEKRHPRLEALLFPSRLDMDSVWNCLSVTDSSAQHHPYTYHGLHFPQREDESSHLFNKEDGECLYSSEPRETTTHFLEGTLNRHDWSSISFQVSVDKQIGHPLFLDNSSGARSKEEIFYDNEQWQCI